MPNYLPPACTLASFLMLLQAVDAYRCALMISMLKHEAADNLQMTVAEFNAGCQSSLQHRDTRWLAPAFVVLIPGFGEYRPS